MPENAETVRLDQWLWAARFFKTRALAKQSVEAGRILVGGEACKPARAVRIGDELSVMRGDERYEISVRALSDRRGPASAAQQLYLEREDSIARRAAERERRKAERAGFSPPESKPDKRARRLIRALGDIDAM